MYYNKHIILYWHIVYMYTLPYTFESVTRSAWLLLQFHPFYAISSLNIITIIYPILLSKRLCFFLHTALALRMLRQLGACCSSDNLINESVNHLKSNTLFYSIYDNNAILIKKWFCSAYIYIYYDMYEYIRM